MTKTKEKDLANKNQTKESGSDYSAGSCLCVMPFREPFDTYYSSVIMPAAEFMKLKCIRADSLFRSSPIMADLWEMIRNATVIVAELTGKNPNVYYELGLAHAIGKPVVLISEFISDVPFDLQSLRVVCYDKNDPNWGSKLKDNIISSLKETLHNPVDSVPPMFRKKVASQAPEESEALIRLDMLEQQVRSLERKDIHRTSTRELITDINDYVYELRGGRISIDEAANITALALHGGIDKETIRIELDKVSAHNNVVGEILSKAEEKYKHL